MRTAGALLCLAAAVALVSSAAMVSPAIPAALAEADRLSIVDAAPGVEPANADVKRPVPGFPNRDYFIHLPTSYNSSNPPPLVMVVHGGAANSTTAMRITCPDGVVGGPKCMAALGDREGFIVAYPNGVRPSTGGESRTYNAGGGKSGFGCVSGYACTSKSDDVGYFRALLDDLSTAFPYDITRVYATGHSNGAAMSARLACELSDRITAIGPVGGADQYSAVDSCNPTRPVPVVHFHGSADPGWPYPGGMGLGGQGPFVSVSKSLDGMVSRNGCAPTSARFEMPDNAQDGTNVTRYTWTGCLGGVEVMHYYMSNTGHTWPDGWQYFGESTIGKTTRDISGNELLWEFFKRFSMGPNRAPGTPTISGPPSGTTNTTLSFEALGTDPDGDQVKYTVEWDDGKSETGPLVNSGTTRKFQHAWSAIGSYYVKAMSTDANGSASPWSAALAVTITGGTQNGAPAAPTLSGPANGIVNRSISFSFTAVDPDSEDVTITANWGDSTTSTSTPTASGAVATMDHTWSDPGSYSVRAQAADPSGALSPWSMPWSLRVDPEGVKSGPAKVTVVPSSVTLDVGQTQLFRADVADASGNPFTGAVITWIPNGLSGTIDQTGLFTATQEGASTVKAVATANGMSAEGDAIIIVRKGGTANVPPTVPTLTGPPGGFVGEALTFNLKSNDPDSSKVRYLIDWGDGSSEASSWVGPGGETAMSHSWSAAGVFLVKARVEDDKGAGSGWSPAISVAIEVDAPQGRPVDPMPALFGVPLYAWSGAALLVVAVAFALAMLSRRRGPRPPY